MTVASFVVRFVQLLDPSVQEKGTEEEPWEEKCGIDPLPPQRTHSIGCIAIGVVGILPRLMDSVDTIHGNHKATTKVHGHTAFSRRRMPANQKPNDSKQYDEQTLERVPSPTTSAATPLFKSYCTA